MCHFWCSGDIVWKNYTYGRSSEVGLVCGHKKFEGALGSIISFRCLISMHYSPISVLFHYRVCLSSPVLPHTFLVVH